MAKKKRKLTAAEKREKARRRAEFMTIFIHGKQKRVRRPVLVEGLDTDEFVRRNADPIWLHQNEMWELMTEVPNPEAGSEDTSQDSPKAAPVVDEDDPEIAL